MSIAKAKELPKSDWHKGIIARLIRENTPVKLDWIRQELNMGVRSSVTRTVNKLKEKMKNDEVLQKVWNDLSEL